MTEKDEMFIEEVHKFQHLHNPRVGALDKLDSALPRLFYEFSSLLQTQLTSQVEIGLLILEMFGFNKFNNLSRFRGCIRKYLKTFLVPVLSSPL